MEQCLNTVTNLICNFSRECLFTSTTLPNHILMEKTRPRHDNDTKKYTVKYDEILCTKNTSSKCKFDDKNVPYKYV